MPKKTKPKKNKNLIKCGGCGHEQKRKSKGSIFRCSQCGWFKKLIKTPDRRFKKNKHPKKSSSHKKRVGESIQTPTLPTPITLFSDHPLP